MAISSATDTLLARAQAARRHEEEEEFDNEITIMDDLTLVSNDGHRYIIERRTAMISQKLRNMLYGAGNFEEAQTKLIRLPIRGIILERIINSRGSRSILGWHIHHPKSS
jgi:hypothetical protein